MPRRTEPKRHPIPFRVTKDEQTMVRLKAAVYCRGNISGFLREAVKAYSGPLPAVNCLHCRTPVDYRFEGTVNWGHATVTNVPVMTCPNCGNESYDMVVMVRVEEAVGGKIGRFDFRELMNRGRSMNSN